MRTRLAIKTASGSAVRRLKTTRQYAAIGVGTCLLMAVGLTVWCVNFAMAGDEPGSESKYNDPLRIPALTGATRIENRPAKAVKWNAEELRLKYPIKSLADRLAYERKQLTIKKQQSFAAGSLTEAAKQSLDAQENSIEMQRRFDLRTRALRELHSDRVARFISQQGFGESRMVMPTPSHLDLPEAPPVQLAHVSSDAYELEGARSLAIPATTSERGDEPGRLPSLSMLRDFHSNNRWNFLTVTAWGTVTGKMQAAGFEGHAFRHLPKLAEPRPSNDDPRPPEPDPKHPWHVTRLELVSLLVHDKPQVYASDRLPKMTEVARAKVRDLNDFEQQGLKTLQAGDDLAADATQNRIRMLGAVRASKQCLDCHEVWRGDLLGAFSYELRRDPPVKPVRKPAA
jgi:hypothetical protein